MEGLNPDQLGMMYGTAWKEAATESLTSLAIENGFRAIDTANQRKHYFEEGVGRALRRAFEKTAREGFFIQTKFTYLDGQDHRLPYDPKASLSDQVKQSFESSLSHLGLSYLDSYVLHGPLQRFGWSDADRQVWQTMESLADEGRTRFLGVSNVGLDQLRSLLSEARIKPSFVQNRCYASTGWDAEIRLLCREHAIIYQGFSLLTANVHLLNQAPVRQIAQKVELSLAQLVFAFAHQVGMLPLTGTTQATHMLQDRAAIGVKLSPEDCFVIENLG